MPLYRFQLGTATLVEMLLLATLTSPRRVNTLKPDVMLDEQHTLKVDERKAVGEVTGSPVEVAEVADLSEGKL